jgi:hypothetical protein
MPNGHFNVVAKKNHRAKVVRTISIVAGPGLGVEPETKMAAYRAEMPRSSSI